MLKGQIIFFALTINHCCGFKERLETLTSSILTNNYCRGLKRRLKILTSSTPTNNYCYGLKERLETQTSSIPINNHCRGLKKGLEIQLVSTTSILFVSGFDILKNMPSRIEPIKMGYAVRYRYCWRSRINNLTPATCSLYKYT